MSSTRPAAKGRTSPPQPPGGRSAQPPDGDHNSVVLGPRDKLVGQLHIEGDLRVVGTVEGALDVTGNVEIDDGGNVTGPVTARNKLVVGRAGSLTGDVRVKRLVVEDGASFSGNVSMGKAAAAPPQPAEPEPVEPPEATRAPEEVKAPEPEKPVQQKGKRR